MYLNAIFHRKNVIDLGELEPSSESSDLPEDLTESAINSYLGKYMEENVGKGLLNTLDKNKNKMEETGGKGTINSSIFDSSINSN